MVQIYSNMRTEWNCTHKRAKENLSLQTALAQCTAHWAPYHPKGLKFSSSFDRINLISWLWSVAYRWKTQNGLALDRANDVVDSKSVSYISFTFILTISILRHVNMHDSVVWPIKFRCRLLVIVANNCSICRVCECVRFFLHLNLKSPVECDHFQHWLWQFNCIAYNLHRREKIRCHMQNCGRNVAHLSVAVGFRLNF